MQSRWSGDTILITGGSGYLGGLITALLLYEDDVNIILPVRCGHSRESVLRPIRAEIAADGRKFHPEYEERLHVIPVRFLNGMEDLARVIGNIEVKEIIHCAGSVHYFDKQELKVANIELTEGILDFARRRRVGRFIYISTAFSSGYTDKLIEEELHPEPRKDPTEYTRSKREAERRVAEGGIPFMIIRPSVVIGDSRTGRYGGKAYGLYQLWHAAERVLCKEWHREFHVVATRDRQHLIHQDAFLMGFIAAYRMLPQNCILNLVSNQEELPSSRELWNLWIDACFRPEIAYYYSTMSQVPLEAIALCQRTFLAFASVNIEMSNYAWRFSTKNLTRLYEDGFEMPRTTLQSVSCCQRRYMEESEVIQTFVSKNRALFADRAAVVEV